MKGSAWTDTEVRYVTQNYGRQDVHEIARILGRSWVAVRSYAKSHGISSGARYFTSAQKAYCRQLVAQGLTAAEIARKMGRKESSIHQLKNRLSLSRKLPRFGPEFQAFLLEKHAAGWSDAEIAQAYGCERHTVGDWRRRLNLPDNNLSARRRRKVAARTRQQCRDAGVKSLAEIRARAFHQYAIHHGLPADLRPRAVHIFNFLLKAGPSTRRTIADGCGFRWRGTRASLKDNSQKGTYLSDLMDRGLVVSLGRVVKGKGKGHSVQLYTVPIAVAEQVLAARQSQRSAYGQQAA